MFNTGENTEIPFGRPWIDHNERQAVEAVLHGHVLTHGPKCSEFEERFSDFTGGGYAVTTSSCMASLHLSALCFGIQPGDEVIVPAQTHVATVHAVEIMGATPIFVDCDATTGNIDLEKVRTAITSKTKMIIVVHFGGIPIDMDALCMISAEFNIKIIEDCALAVGATFKNKHVGLWGDAGCFSFYPVKHITTGEGGMFISKNEDVVNWAASFRAFNVDRTFRDRKIAGVYDVNGVGLNYRMSEMQAALGCEQVKKLPDILQKRRNNFLYLKEQLLRLDGISVLDSRDVNSVSSHYCLLAILDEGSNQRRNDLITSLTSNKIGCSVYYPQPVPRMKYYAEKYGYEREKYKNAERVSDQGIALPVGPHLSEQHMESIYQHIKNAISST